MMIEVDIPDGSDELEELKSIIAQMNAEHPENLITEAQYVNNIIIGYFQNRVRNEYIGHAKKQDIIVLKKAFGDLISIRSK